MSASNFPESPPSFHSAAATLLCRRLRLYLMTLQANGCRMLHLCLLSVRRVWSLFLQPLASFVRVLAMLFFSLTPRLGIGSSMLQSQRLLFSRGLISCCCAACCLELPVVRPFWWVCRCCVRPLLALASFLPSFLPFPTTTTSSTLLHHNLHQLSTALFHISNGNSFILLPLP